MERVEVNASALRENLQALNGPDYLIRELQVIQEIQGNASPINILTNEFNAAVDVHNAASTTSVAE